MSLVGALLHIVLLVRVHTFPNGERSLADFSADADGWIWFSAFGAQYFLCSLGQVPPPVQGHEQRKLSSHIPL